MVEADSYDISLLAERMLRDYDARTPGTVFAEAFRPSLAVARQLQDAVARLRMARGEQVVGYKIGCVCPHNQKKNGLSHPVWGRLWSSEQHVDGARLAKSNFANVAIEGEFAVTIDRNIDPGDTTLARVASAIERVVPVIELHNLVFRGGDPKGAELIANNAIHSGVVRGSGGPAATDSVVSDLSIAFDGEPVDEWSDVCWPDDILQAVGWLAENLAEIGLGLESGQTILTGALGPPLPVSNVNHVQIHSSRFGDVQAWFA